MFIPRTATVLFPVFFFFFDVALEMIFIFEGGRCRPGAVVAVVRPSSVVVVCFSDPLLRRKFCAHLRLERFASRLHSASLTPRFSVPLFQTVVS